MFLQRVLTSRWPQCASCGYRDAQKSNIKAHVRAHHAKGPLPLLCCADPDAKDPSRICGKLYKASGSMTRHRNQKHGGATNKKSPIAYPIRGSSGMYYLEESDRSKIMLRLPPNIVWEDSIDSDTEEETNIGESSSFTLRTVCSSTW